MILMIYKEYKKHMVLIEKMDKKFENTLTNYVYDNIVSLCEEKSLQAQNKHYDKLLKRQELENGGQLSYIEMCHTKCFEMSKQITKTSTEVSRMMSSLIWSPE